MQEQLNALVTQNFNLQRQVANLARRTEALHEALNLIQSMVEAQVDARARAEASEVEARYWKGKSKKGGRGRGRQPGKSADRTNFPRAW